MTKERWYNYRPICIVFAFLLLGSVFAYFVTIHTLISIISAVSVLILFLIIAIIKRKVKLLLIPLLSFIIGCGAYNLTVFNFNQGLDNPPATIQARVCSVGKQTDDYLYLEADSCIFDEEKINDKIIIYVSDSKSLYENLQVGSVIKFSTSSFYYADLFYHEIPNAKYIYENIKYITNVNIKNIKVLDVDKTIPEQLKENIKENLSLGLTNENVELAYSALFGEKDMLSESQYSAYRLSGIAHLLAVSGLHVGIITGILYFFLNKCKIKKWGRLFIVSIFLLAYMMLCNFAVSVVRASIMAIILVLSDIFGREYDSFCAISVAGIIIYATNPLCVFDVSFLMSFGCAMGIAMLYRPITKALIKAKFPKIVASSVAMSLSSTITLIIIMAFFFRTLNIISVVANLIIIPIFTLAFVSVFVISLLAMIPNIGYLLLPINYIFDFINIIANLFGGMFLSNLNTLGFNYIAIVVYFVLILTMGRLCTANYKYKIAVTLPMVALLFCCLL